MFRSPPPPQESEHNSPTPPQFSFLIRAPSAQQYSSGRFKDRKNLKKIERFIFFDTSGDTLSMMSSKEPSRKIHSLESSTDNSRRSSEEQYRRDRYIE